MNKDECDQLNADINQISRLREGFYLSGFLVQPQLFHITNPLPESQLSEHSHPTFEVSIILEGTFTYIIDKKQITLTSGDLIIIPPRQKHSWKLHDDTTTISSFMCSISWKGEGPRRKKIDLLNSIEKRQYKIKKFANYEVCIRNIIDLLDKRVTFREDELRNLQKNSYIYLLRTLLPELSESEYLRKEVDYKNKDQLIDQVKHYIFDNLSRPISLDELQKNFGYSKEHLNRVFKKHQKMTIGQFIMNRKIELASKRLTTSHVDIKTIALELGFSDVNYFYAVFKKIIGRSPSEYRKRNQKN